GILIDKAEGLVYSKVPAPSQEQIQESLLDAQENCFAVGLTTVTDCGMSYRMIPIIDSLQKTSKLKMRIYGMLSGSERNFEYLFENGPVKTDRLHIRSFKIMADGALGSRGACLLEPYSDRPAYRGFLLNDKKYFQEVAERLAKSDFQMNTHAIGDSANREILTIYANVLKGKNDRRWRIEHAQVIHPDDFKLF